MQNIQRDRECCKSLKKSKHMAILQPSEAEAGELLRD